MILRTASRSSLVMRGMMSRPELNSKDGFGFFSDVAEGELVELVIVAGVRGVMGPHGATGPFENGSGARGVLLPIDVKRCTPNSSVERTVGW